MCKGSSLLLLPLLLSLLLCQLPLSVIGQFQWHPAPLGYQPPPNPPLVDEYQPFHSPFQASARQPPAIAPPQLPPPQPNSPAAFRPQVQVPASQPSPEAADNPLLVNTLIQVFSPSEAADGRPAISLAEARTLTAVSGGGGGGGGGNQPVLDRLNGQKRVVLTRHLDTQARVFVPEAAANPAASPREIAFVKAYAATNSSRMSEAQLRAELTKELDSSVPLILEELERVGRANDHTTAEEPGPGKTELEGLIGEGLAELDATTQPPVTSRAIGVEQEEETTQPLIVFTRQRPQTSEKPVDEPSKEATEVRQTVTPTFIVETLAKEMSTATPSSTSGPPTAPAEITSERPAEERPAEERPEEERPASFAAGETLTVSQSVTATSTNANEMASTESNPSSSSEGTLTSSTEAEQSSQATSSGMASSQAIEASPWPSGTEQSATAEAVTSAETSTAEFIAPEPTATITGPPSEPSSSQSAGQTSVQGMEASSGMSSVPASFAEEAKPSTELAAPVVGETTTASAEQQETEAGSTVGGSESPFQQTGSLFDISTSTVETNSASTSEAGQIGSSTGETGIPSGAQTSLADFPTTSSEISSTSSSTYSEAAEETTAAANSAGEASSPGISPEGTSLGNSEETTATTTTVPAGETSEAPSSTEQQSTAPGEESTTEAGTTAAESSVGTTSGPAEQEATLTGSIAGAEGQQSTLATELTTESSSTASVEGGEQLPPGPGWAPTDFPEGQLWVRCLPSAIRAVVRSSANQSLPAGGALFAKDFHDQPKCFAELPTSKGDTAEEEELKLEIEQGQCGLASTESTEPPSRNLSLVLIFAPRRALVLDSPEFSFLVQCLAPVLPAQQQLSADLTIQEPAAAPVQAQTIALEQAPPNCEYSLRRDSPNGPLVEKASLGQAIFHRWECRGGPEAAQQFGMFLSDCVVANLSGEHGAPTAGGQPVKLVDSDGCSTDSVLLADPEYADGRLLATARARAFSLRPGAHFLRFSCRLSLCLRQDGGCHGLIPPLCPPANDTGGNQTLAVSRRHSLLAAQQSAMPAALSQQLLSPRLSVGQQEAPMPPRLPFSFPASPEQGRAMLVGSAWTVGLLLGAAALLGALLGLASFLFHARHRRQQRSRLVQWVLARPNSVESAAASENGGDDSFYDMPPCPDDIPQPSSASSSPAAQSSPAGGNGSQRRNEEEEGDGDGGEQPRKDNNKKQTISSSSDD